jgi:Flp pilus assembly protein TadB
MDTLVVVLVGAALGACVVVLALALLTCVLVRRGRLGRVRARGRLQLPGALWAGEIEASSRK